MFIHYIIDDDDRSDYDGNHIHKHLTWLLNRIILSENKDITISIYIKVNDNTDIKLYREDYWTQKFKLNNLNVELIYNFWDIGITKPHIQTINNSEKRIYTNISHGFDILSISKYFKDTAELETDIYGWNYYSYYPLKNNTSTAISNILISTDELKVIEECINADQLSLFKVGMAANINEYTDPVLKSGYVTQGPKVKEFEEKLSEFIGNPYVLTVNSATSGLTLACRLLNLDQNSEVISTPLTCTATNFPILNFGAHVVWADVDENTCNIDLDSVKSKLTPSTRAIMVVHWGGYPVDLDKLKEVQDYAEDKYGFRPMVIEDCAHAFGSEYKGKKLGTHGNICVFSFQAIKHLTCTDGGAIVLPDYETYKRAKLLRWFGIDREERSSGTDFRLEKDISEFGYKFHMNDLMASIGIANMQNIEFYLDNTRNNVKKLRNGLKNIPLISHLENKDDRLASYWLFTIKINDKHAFIRYMKNCNIMVSQVHRRNDVHSCLSSSRCSLPQLDKLESKIICVPCGWWLSDVQINYIINCIKEWPVNHLTYRELESTDYNSYISLLKQLTNYNYDITQTDFDKILNAIVSQGGKIYIVLYNNAIIATCKVLCEIKFGDPVLHLEDVVVDSHFRGFGIGKELIRQVKEYGCYKGAYKIILDAKDHLDSFYTRCGFTKEGSLYTLRLK